MLRTERWSGFCFRKSVADLRSVPYGALWKTFRALGLFLLRRTVLGHDPCGLSHLIPFSRWICAVISYKQALDEAGRTTVAVLESWRWCQARPQERCPPIGYEIG